jgi:predicted phosphoribosyltransferase
MQPEDFGAVGRFYVDFTPVAEHEVHELLEEARIRTGSRA